MLYAADLFLIPESKDSKGTKGFINKLGHIQWQARLHITGTLRSAPTDDIDACADLLLFHLLVEKVVNQAATWLASLPNSHPMARQVCRSLGHRQVCYVAQGTGT